MIVHSSKSPIVLNESISYFVKKIKKYKKDLDTLSKSNNKEVKTISPEDKAKMNKIGDQIQKYVIANLKKYASTKEFKNKYKDHITEFSINIGEDNAGSAYGVKISDFQDGIDLNYIDKWEKKNPNKDINECPILNSDWYWDLLNKGKELAKKANKIYNKNNEYHLGVDTGDGDEATIYIDLYI